MIRTWPYGTTRRATVLKVQETPSGFRTVTLVDDQNEGHILLGVEGDAKTCVADDKGTVVFTSGGPTGGYWLFTKDKP